MNYYNGHEETNFRYTSEFFSCKKNRILEFLSKIMESKELHHSDSTVFLLIACMCKYPSQQCKYNIPTLAKILKMDKSNLYKSIERLVKAGIIKARQEDGEDIAIYLNFNYVSEGTKIKTAILNNFEIDEDISLAE